MVISSPCLIDNKELTSPEQTAPGKDFSNPLIVDSLLKTIWLSMHHVFLMKHWLVQSKRLLKSTGSAGFHQVIGFLNRSHICYVLTKKPADPVSFIKQFWRSAEASTDDNGEVKIIATIDGHSMTITEASLRRHLKLDDQDGITSIPNLEIFEQLALMGYHTDSDKLTFQKGAFSPQWRFLIHNILHCLSLKKTAWEQFSSNIATAVICLATNRKYNFSRMIFEHMVSNISSPYKFFMYPRSDEGSLKLNELMNLVTKLSDRIGVLEDDLRKKKKTYSSAFTKLILRVKKLKARVKIRKLRQRAKVVLSEDDADVQDDSSKQGRKLSDAEVQENTSTETKPFIQEVTPTEVIQDQGSSEKGSAEVSTAGAKKGTSSEVLVVSTAKENVSTAEENVSTAGRTVTYSRRSEEKRTRQDKGKAIMIESEPKKKSKKELEQERLSFAKAIRLEEQMNEEQRAQIARDEEIARQWDEKERQRAMSEAKSTKKIDWNNPSVIRYHALKMKPKTIAHARRNMIKYLKNQGNYKISDFKGMSYNEIRLIFEKVWDFNQHIKPMEHGPEKMKSPEKIEEEEDIQKEMKEVVKESGAKRKKSLPRKRRTDKRQKLEEDAEKEELKGFLDIIPREEFAKDVESLSTKYPIVDWKTYTLTKNFILVKERYSALRPKGYDLMLWGDLHTLFEPNEEDEIWKNQHEYNVISWSLYVFCGIHILLMQNGIAIHMLTKKKYPLSQEMISKMLKKKLEVDHESSHAFELLRIDQGVGSTNGIRACALRNFDLGVMELENSQNNALEVIENGNSWVPIPVTATETGPSTRLKMTVPSTAEEKICKKNDVKARSLLLMVLPNEHQLTFDQYVNAQSMFAAIKARFGGNEATKKTKKALLKQQYKNFNALSSESLDSIFNMLQKLVSRLAILDVVTPLEVLNVKFLRSLPSEWDTHMVVWMNKPDFDTMGLDDLYNNFKIVEQKVKRSVGANNDDKNLAFLLHCFFFFFFSTQCWISKSLRNSLLVLLKEETQKKDMYEDPG
ncbi:hypothetical protein Tco_0751150 [Tanacetum coccineum]|uniref:Uncharacterized protein n=1 Tax=Tanacetum coccineum TaxID=301880 RepID=A0ABQ4Z392_9ASTR